MSSILNLVFTIWILGIFPMRFFLVSKTSFSGNPWLQALVWPVPFFLWYRTKSGSRGKSTGNSSGMNSGGATPPPQGYSSGPNSSGPTPPPPPPSN